MKEQTSYQVALMSVRQLNSSFIPGSSTWWILMEPEAHVLQRLGSVQHKSICSPGIFTFFMRLSVCPIINYI